MANLPIQLDLQLWRPMLQMVTQKCGSQQAIYTSSLSDCDSSISVSRQISQSNANIFELTFSLINCPNLYVFLLVRHVRNHWIKSYESEKSTTPNEGELANLLGNEVSDFVLTLLIMISATFTI